MLGKQPSLHCPTRSQNAEPLRGGRKPTSLNCCLGGCLGSLGCRDHTGTPETHTCQRVLRCTRTLNCVTSLRGQHAKSLSFIGSGVNSLRCLLKSAPSLESLRRFYMRLVRLQCPQSHYEQAKRDGSAHPQTKSTKGQSTIIATSPTSRCTQACIHSTHHT